jgi:hypothetical protein
VVARFAAGAELSSVVTVEAGPDRSERGTTVVYGYLAE